MAKAKSPVSPPARPANPDHRLSPRAAAATILQLISSQPHTPSLKQIEAITSRVAFDAPNTQAALAEWHQILDEHLKRRDALSQERERDKLKVAMATASEAILELPTKTWADLLVKVAVCVHWNSHGGLPAYPNNALDTGPLDERACAVVVRGILDLTGLSVVDEHGRIA
jgi:hypothetical protein